MIALQRIREDADAIREGARLKGEAAPIDEIVALDGEARALRTRVEAARADQKRASAAFRGQPTDAQRVELAAVRARIQDGEVRLGELDARVQELLLSVPNPPHESVPHGTGDDGNVTIRTWGVRPSFDFAPRTHYDIGERLGIFDFERAVKISGSRFAVVQGAGARLQRAMISLMLDMATLEHGYSEIAPPYLVRREAMVGTANLPDKEGLAYETDDDLFLIPTAEVPVTNLYRDEILDGSRLPIAHAAHTPCFRREAGAAGKDTRGYIRMHQFDKVEMVRFVDPATSLEQLDVLVGHAEAVLQRLGLHYRVLLMCAGDTGFSQWKKFDLEVWCPGLDRWLEVSSCSVFGDFQARRVGIRFRPAPGAKPEYVHTINGSGLAVPRTLDGILETHQNADGSVTIPEPLRGYMGGMERLG